MSLDNSGMTQIESSLDNWQFILTVNMTNRMINLISIAVGTQLSYKKNPLDFPRIYKLSNKLPDKIYCKVAKKLSCLFV